MLQVGLVDDHAVVRSGYRRLLELERDIAVAAEYGDAETAFQALIGPKAPPLDLLIVDISMPGLSGLDLLRRLTRRGPRPRVLIFTMYDSAAMLDQCMRAGAIGYITKSCDPATLVRAVRRASRGLTALSPDMQALAEQVVEGLPHTRLSAREFEVLQQLLAGRSLDDVAQSLGLSGKTVSNYQTRIRQMLGVNSAIEMINYGYAHGLIGR